MLRGEEDIDSSSLLFFCSMVDTATVAALFSVIVEIDRRAYGREARCRYNEMKALFFSSNLMLWQ